MKHFIMEGRPQIFYPDSILYDYKDNFVGCISSCITVTTMVSSLSSPSSFATFRLPNQRRRNSGGGVIKCESNGSQLEIGSPVIVVEAPKTIKTAASVPCLRVNSGLVNPGDVGRIVSRKPRDVWAVRLAIGTYLIDRKYFKPLNIAAESNDDTPEPSP